jgi:rSAM/selenodomain-associated transferase 1
MTRLPSPTELLVFARYPRAGAVKTRLIPALGTHGAAELHARLVRRTLVRARDWATACGARVTLSYTGCGETRMRRWLAEAGIPTPGPGGLQLSRQPEGDLGERLAAAFAAAFAGGAAAVAAVGTDCPDLDAVALDRALADLARANLVIGPAADGGYYLIGLRAPAPALFRGIPWGTSSVCAETLARAATLGLACRELDVLPDVDRPADLELVGDLVRDIAAADEGAPRSASRRGGTRGC